MARRSRHLNLTRFVSDNQSTLGLLGVDGKFLCFTLEDGHKDAKVKHKTRIPAGHYKVIPRAVGGFHERYSKRWTWHDHMMQIIPVDGGQADIEMPIKNRRGDEWKYILFHPGNTHEDTSGCVLLGFGCQAEDGDMMVTSSRAAYQSLYINIAQDVADPNCVVYLTIHDADRGSIGR